MCSLVDGNQSFRGTYYLYLQGGVSLNTAEDERRILCSFDTSVTVMLHKHSSEDRNMKWSRKVDERLDYVLL
jgi:hypothetical protein